MILKDVSEGKNNNLNVIRFIAAAMVVFGHSYALGSAVSDPLSRLTSGQLDFGSLAVSTFFFFSGFLINKSVCKSKSAYSFFAARCIRIFPCLAAIVFICAFVLGGIVTQCNRAEYFMNIHTYEYLLNSIFILRHQLPGVFENNIFNSTVNGSLWTLPVEFICYIICYIAWKIKLSDKKIMKYTIPLFVIAYIALSALLSKIPLLYSTLRPCGMFYMGMLFYTYREYIRIKFTYVILCIIGLILSIYLHIFNYAVFIFMPYILIYAAFGTNRKFDGFGRNHELSYCMYLCAFPIQQTITMAFGGSVSPYINFLLGMPFIILAAFILNIFIEKPCARLKSLI